mmetsp:Transcript_30983/g.81101  ORF Transcript_30983/g.81101 Transcript_30983/m.81101 type:complete len:520 (+) Transcript_30983:49-1608(+)
MGLGRHAVMVSAAFSSAVAVCEYHAPSGKTYDFTKLVLPSGRDYAIQSSSPEYKYFFNFCGGVASKPGTPPDTGCSSADGACQLDSVGSGFYYSLGKLSTAEWAEHADGVSLHYTGGSSDWEDRPRQVLVTITCARDGRPIFGPAMEDPDVTKALYYINISVPEACRAAPTPPPQPHAATCQEVLYEDPTARDGEYLLHCPEAGVTLSVWCHGMGTESPREYLSLPFEGNYAEYLCGPRCKERHPTSSTVTTVYAKVRLNPCSLEVDVQDRTFASSTGSITHGDDKIETVPFGVAASCEDAGGAMTHPGKSMIDLGGTALMVESTWTHQGEDSYAKVTFTDMHHQQATIEGGGFCGQASPVGFQMYEPPTTPQWVLKLKAAGPVPPGPPPPPSPPTPPSPSWRWSVAGGSYAGMSCTTYCQTHGSACVEGANWPKSQLEFEQILAKVPGGTAGCTSLTPGNPSYGGNPQRASASGQGICYWDSQLVQKRCESSPSPNHARFCPCSLHRVHSVRGRIVSE